MCVILVMKDVNGKATCKDIYLFTQEINLMCVILVTKGLHGKAT